MRHVAPGRAFVCGFAALALVAASPAPRGHQQPAPTGTGAISGVVVDDATGQPIRHAAVGLVPTRPGLFKGVNADDAGRFRFDRIASGSYVVSASALRYTRVEYGATKPGGAGRPVVVAETATVSDLTIRLSRDAVITGRVSSPAGEPLVDVDVYLWQWGPTSADGRRSLVIVPIGGVASDDRGIYRLYDVPPGEYLVATTAERQIIDGAGPDRSKESLPVIRHADVEALLRGGTTAPPGPASHARYVQTFHPSATSGSDAALISVSAGEERTGVDITVKSVTTAAIRGTVTMPAGVTQPTTFVQLLSVGRTPGDGQGMEDMSRVENGAFKFENVPPGDYVVSARVAVGATPASPAGVTAPSDIWLASTPVSLNGRDITDLVLTLQLGLTVSGRVRYEGASPPAATGLHIGLKAVLAPNQVSFSAPSTIDSAGRFSVSGVTPGQYVVSLDTGGRADDARWWLKSAFVNGRDVADYPIEVGSDVADVVVTLTDRPASVSGTVSTASGDTARPWVIVFATDRAFWMPQSRRIAGVRTQPDGSYRIGRLPAGEYFIAVATDVTKDQWFDTAFLDRLAAAAPLRITLADGEQKTQSLRIR